MIAIDANILSLLIYPGCRVPLDFRTGDQITKARDRLDALIDTVSDDGETILIPTPALAESLVTVAPDVDRHIQELQAYGCFRFSSFGPKAAVELAIQHKRAKNSGDKYDGVEADWAKVKYDRQIVAIAKAEGVRSLYSLDRDIHTHAAIWGIQALSLADVPLPPTQTEMFNNAKEETRAADTSAS